MRMDWPLIGAMSGLSASVLVLGVGAAAILRSGPDEVRKSPPPAPVLLSSSRPIEPAAPPAPVLQVYAGSAGATNGSAPVERQRPAPVYELFPASTTASAAPAVAELRPAPQEYKSRIVAPVVAKPAPEPKKPATAYALATANPAAPKPQVNPEARVEPPKIVDHRYDGVLTMAEIAKVKARLRLSPDQEPLWRPVEVELRKVGRMQMALIDAGKKPDVPQSALQPLGQAAMPLFQTLRPDQKEQVRVLARKMGYGNVASMI
jgi:hypothetical protein